jgi:hypothetical protein
VSIVSWIIIQPMELSYRLDMAIEKKLMKGILSPYKTRKFKLSAIDLQRLLKLSILNSGSVQTPRRKIMGF